MAGEALAASSSSEGDDAMNIGRNIEELLQQFLDQHPQWNTDLHVFTAALPADRPPDDWITVDALRAFIAWARAQNFITRAQATSLETICRRVDHWAQSEGF
jgi:hypothetical protein